MLKKTILAAVCVCLVAAGAIIVVTESRAAASAKWLAVVLEGGNLSGDLSRYQSNYGGYVYDDAESAVEVYATMGMMSGSGGTYWTIFRTWIYYPEKIYIDGMDQFTSFEQDTTPGLVFNGYPPGGQATLTQFLNGPHPYDQRYTINIGFFGPYVNSRAEADWENKPVGWILPGRAFIMITDATSGDCNVCSATDYHEIQIQTHDAELVKESSTSYLVKVHTTFSDPAHAIVGPPWTTNITKDYILNQYCVCVPRTSKRSTYYVKEYRYPELAKAPMDFEIRYVKR